MELKSAVEHWGPMCKSLDGSISLLISSPGSYINCTVIPPVQMTKSEDVAATLAVAVRSRVMRLWTLSRPMERNCDVILKAKMLLQACDSLMDELIQYFYYTAAYENGSH